MPEWIVEAETLEELENGFYTIGNNGEPVKHGRWTRKESKRSYWFECSECGYPPPLDKFKREWFSNYCPNCGAKMDEVKNG